MLSPEQSRKIGGSDVAALVGLSPYRRPIDVWRRVVEGHETPDSPILKRGRMLEPVVRELYRETVDAKLLGPANLEFAGKPFLRASLDDMAEVNGERRVVELKTAHWRTAEQWGPSEVPAQYAVQAQWYLKASGLKHADLAVLFGLDDFRVQALEADGELQEMLLDAATRFYVDHIKPQRPPKPDGSDSYAEWLAARYPVHRAPLMQADADMEALFADLRSFSSVLEHTQEKLEAIRNAIKAKLGEAEGARGRFGKCSWKATKGRTSTDWEAIARHFNPEPELVAQHTNTKPGPRVFRVTFANGVES